MDLIRHAGHSWIDQLNWKEKAALRAREDRVTGQTRHDRNVQLRLDITPENPDWLVQLNEDQADFRLRVLQFGAETLLDREILEMLLHLSNPKIRARMVSRKLLTETGGFRKAMTMSLDVLTRIAGDGLAVAEIFALTRATAKRLAQEDEERKPAFRTLNDIITYLKTACANMCEHRRVLYLDARNRLLRDCVQQNHHFCSKPIITRALKLYSTAIVLVHFQANSDLSITEEDVAIAGEVQHSCMRLSIACHDYIPLNNDKYMSLRYEGLIRSGT